MKRRYCQISKFKDRSKKYENPTNNTPAGLNF